MATFASFLPTAGTPLGGFSSALGEEGVLYDSAAETGVGPGGENSLRITYRNGPAWDAQHSVGVNRSGIGTSPSQGMELFIKWVWRIQNGHTAGTTYDGKVLIIGDSGVDFMRIICNIRDNGVTADSHVFNCGRNIDGPTASTGFVTHAEDAWHYVQVYVKSSTHAAAISSITRSGSTATVTTSTPHGLATNDLVDIGGAFPGGQFEYAGVFTATVTGASTFTYPVSGTPTTPATGTDMLATSADAEIRVWVDNSDDGFASPAANTSGDTFGLLADATTWGATFGYGYFNASNGGTHNPPPILDLGPLYIGDTFDATWGTGSAPGGALGGMRAVFLGVL